MSSLSPPALSPDAPPFEPLCTAALSAISQRILTELSEHASNAAPLDLARVELCSRVLCQQMKAAQALEAYNLRHAKAQSEKEYTRYEDLPPLRPEERERLKQFFIDGLAPRGGGGERGEPGGLYKPPKGQH